MALLECKVGDELAVSVSLKKAEDRNAIDIYSLVYKVRIFELLGQRNRAISTLEVCLKMGATANQIRCTNDLEALCLDPRYLPLMQSATVNRA